jgi:hypothetical protein
VLIVRLAKNHPLPDGNKRVLWVALRMFVEIDGWSWSERPSVDEAEQVVLAIAAGSGTRTAPPNGSVSTSCARPRHSSRLRVPPPTRLFCPQLHPGAYEMSSASLWVPPRSRVMVTARK